MKMLIATLLLTLPLIASAECAPFDTACQQRVARIDLALCQKQLQEKQDNTIRLDRGQRGSAGFKPFAPVVPLGAKHCEQVQIQGADGLWRWVSVCD